MCGLGLRSRFGFAFGGERPSSFRASTFRSRSALALIVARFARYASRSNPMTRARKLSVMPPSSLGLWGYPPPGFRGWAVDLIRSGAERSGGRGGLPEP